MNTENKKIRILVAEDETIIRLDLVEMLTESGYEVVAQAENGAVAIELAKKFKPDLAILDVKMPERWMALLLLNRLLLWRQC